VEPLASAAVERVGDSHDDQSTGERLGVTVANPA
jgi:hypothetical protein